MSQDELKRFLDKELDKAEQSHQETLRRHNEIIQMISDVRRKYPPTN